MNHLTDILYFGAMKPCLICGNGQFLFKNSIYCCTGNISEWSKCTNTVKTPRRVPVQIPEKYQVFLRGKFNVRNRILNDVPKINDEDFVYVKIRNNCSDLLVYFTVFHVQFADYA